MFTSSTTACGGGPPSPEGEGFWLLFLPSPLGEGASAEADEVNLEVSSPVFLYIPANSVLYSLQEDEIVEEWRRAMIRVESESEGERMDISVTGEALVTEGSVRLRWTERLEEDSGFSQETRAALQARDGHAMMQRKGSYAVSMVFAPGESHETVYRTPYGELPVAVRAETVRLTMPLNAEGGEIFLAYSLQIQGGAEDQRRMRLTWRWADADPGAD